MTEVERAILKRDEEQQTQLSSELASRSSFIGAIATLAAFLVIQWAQASKHDVIAVLLYVAIALSFILLLFASAGQKYLYPAKPLCWRDWLEKRKSGLLEYGWSEDRSGAHAERELEEAVFVDIANRSGLNRSANKHKAVFLSASGIIAVVAVLSILLLSALSRVGLF
jgi:hypothetical protein